MTSRRANLPLVFGLLLTGALLILLSRETADLIAVTALFAAALSLPRVRLDALAQLALVLLLPTAAAVLILLLPESLPNPPTDRIGPVSRAACLGFLSVTALRLRMIRAPWAGDAMTAGIGFLALVSLGSPSRGLWFPIISIPALLLLTVGAGIRDPARRTERGNVRYVRAVALLIATAGAVTALLVFSLPRLYARAMSIIEADWNAPETGFGFDLSLGDLDGLALSDTMVMRLHGRRADYLRGAVYTRYRNGRWLEGIGEGRTQLNLSSNTAPSPGETELRFLDAPKRFFLPQDAELLALTPAQAELSASGIVKPSDEATAKSARIRIRPHNPSKTETPPTDPTLTEVPKNLASNLFRIAAGWTTGTAGTSDRLAALKALERRLQREYAYSLHVSTPQGKDPVLWFLTDGRAGWCETFASAMVLLARAQGIPARVVGGYRVHERNPVGDYYVVREKNAHAWVEAYVQGVGWTRFDPTPAEGEVADADTGWISAAVDAAVDALDRMEWRAVHFVAVTLLLVSVWIAVRLVRRRRARRAARFEEGPGYTPPPVHIAKLLNALSQAGFPRNRHEPLERYIPRLSAALPEFSPFADAPTILAAHMERRYGKSEDVLSQ